MTSRLARLAPVAAALLAATNAQASQCFTMFDAKNGAVLQTATTPIDLSLSIGDQMRARFPGRYLVISDVGTCAEIGTGSTSVAAAGGDPASLLRARNVVSSSGTGAMSAPSNGRGTNYR